MTSKKPEFSKLVAVIVPFLKPFVDSRISEDNAEQITIQYGSSREFRFLFRKSSKNPEENFLNFLVVCIFRALEDTVFVSLKFFQNEKAVVSFH